MLRKSKKSLALLIALMMLATLFVGIPSASAAGAINETVTSIPTVNSNAGDIMGASIAYIENTDFQNLGITPDVHEITVTLNTDGVSFRDAAIGNAVPLAGGGAFVAALDLAGADRALTFASVRNVSSNSYTFSVTDPGGAGPAGFQLFFPVTVAGATAGDDIVVQIDCDTLDLERERVIGKIAAEGTTTASLSSNRVAQIDEDANSTAGSENNRLGMIRITESVVDSLPTGTQIRLDLPAGVSWNEGIMEALITPAAAAPNNLFAQVQGVHLGAGAVAPITAVEVTTNSAGNSRLIVTLGTNPQGGSRAMIDVDPYLNLDDTVATGDIYCSISGSNSGVTSQSIKIGVAGQYETTAEIKGDPNVVMAGAIDQELSAFSVIESAPGSLIEGRAFTIELPSYVHWFTDPNIKYEKGDIRITTTDMQTTDVNRYVKRYNVERESSTASTITFERARVFVDPDAPEGDIVLTVKGNSGVEAEVVVGTINKSITAEGGASNVGIGVANQPVADVTITEDIKGAFHGNPTVINHPYGRDGGPIVNTTTNARALTVAAGTGELIISAPNGVTFATVPKVEVTEGDLRLVKESTRLIGNDSAIRVQVQNPSTTPSTISITDIELTLNRTVPEGVLKLGITGTSIDRVSEDNDVNVQEVAVATVVTPAPIEQKVVASFTIDETSYTVNDEEFNMDVAPYIKDDRTFLPIRYVALALGVQSDNINWNDETKTAVLIKGNTYVQLQAGSNIMKVNGVEIMMDTIPEIVDGRMMIPLRYATQAFGATVNWDEDSRVATFTLSN